jgi:molecular chaperone HscC
VLIPNALGSFLTPSIVGVLEDGQWVVGEPAKELQVTGPDQTGACFKRWMGTDRQVQVGERTLTPIELSSLVLKSLREDAEAFLNHRVDSAVITVPAYFNDHQRQATQRAGELAGLRVRRIINEPTAAALTYGFHDRSAEKHLLVVDLGGGTFDVTLMEIFDGTLEIIATAGESMLGGEDFTDRIVAYALQTEGLALETAEMRFPLRVARLRQECERAKRALASEAGAQIRLPDDQGTFDAARSVTIDQTTFAGLVAPLMERLKLPLTRALRDGNRGPREIDEIILVGGATRMVVLQSYIQTTFAKPGVIKFNPDEVVAVGAAVQAALIQNQAAVSELVMTDVCPFTLGVEIVKEFGGRLESGYFQPLIHRNTTIPVSREELFATVAANQREVLVKIYQGESRKVADNLCLGELRIVDIPPGPAGQEILVRFTYDLNGLLEVEAVVPGSGRKYNTVLTQHAVALSKVEMEQAVRNLGQLKFYPRDELPNQRLLRYAERRVGEISPFQREQLEDAIDQFQDAMVAGDREGFESARRDLLLTLEQLGIPYGAAEDEVT